jgi:geranylgeranyl reductase
MPDYDVIIIGGGPAGATAAISCNRLGLTTLLVEKGQRDRLKPCGGVLPKICVDLLKETIGASIPENIMSEPSSLGLYYVPPSGRKNSGRLRNYTLLNIDRTSFDQWLRDIAEEERVEVRYDTVFQRFIEDDVIKVSLNDGNTTQKSTRYLIGADGVQSKVREQLFGPENRITYVFQEKVEGTGDFENNFYFFMGEDISPTYAYLIPKKDYIKIGIGVPEPLLKLSTSYFARFKELLTEEFHYQQNEVISSEVWGIPYGFSHQGKNNILLAGDAAGFCNTFSGEGIRHAIDSGASVGYAVESNLENGEGLLETYIHETRQLKTLVHHTHNFVTSLNDEKREEFIKSELSRRFIG